MRNTWNKQQQKRKKTNIYAHQLVYIYVCVCVCVNKIYFFVHDTVHSSSIIDVDISIVFIHFIRNECEVLFRTHVDMKAFWNSALYLYDFYRTEVNQLVKYLFQATRLRNSLSHVFSFIFRFCAKVLHLSVTLRRL